MTANKDNITLRSDRASPLTQAEVDQNFQESKNAIDELGRRVVIRENRGDLKSRDNEVGWYIQLSGLTANDDGRGGLYVVKEPNTGTADDETIIALDNGNQAHLVGYVSTGSGVQSVRGALDQRVIYVDTIADLQAINTTSLVDGQLFNIKNVLFQWNSENDKWENISGYITPEAFGAIGDGVDDTAALQSALTYASSNGVRLLGNSSSTYRISSNVSVSRSSTEPDLIVDWGGSTIICDESKFSIGGASETILETTFLSYAKRGDPKLTLLDTNGIEPGDQIYIESPVYISAGIPVMHYYLVEEVDGNDVYIEGTVIADINTTQITNDGETGDYSITVSRLPRYCEMVNGTFIANDPDGLFTTSSITRHYRVVVDNIQYKGQTRNQLALFYNGHTLVTRTKFHDFGYIEKDSGYVSLTGAPDGQSFGYGLILSRNCFSISRDIVGGRGWHVSDVSRGQMWAWFHNVVCLRNSYGLAQHDGCWYTHYDNCTVIGNSGAHVLNSAYLTITNCKFIDNYFNPITYGSDQIEVIIINCNIDMISEPGTSVYAIRITDKGDALNSRMSSGHTRKFKLSGCDITTYGYISSGLSESLTKISDNTASKLRAWEITNKGDLVVGTHIKGNVIGQFGEDISESGRAFHCNVDGNLYIDSNTVTQTGGGSKSLAWVAPNITVYLTNNTALCGYLCSSFTGYLATVKVSSHNVANARLYGSDITVDNSLYNSYGLSHNGTVNQSVGDVLLV